MKLDKSYVDYVKMLFDSEKLFDKPEALKGVRVLEVSYVILGPAVVDYLAELGAEIIKLEDKDGDLLRYTTPFDEYYKNLGFVFMHNNHNKHYVGMDLRHPKAKELFLELVKKSDVIVENLAPGTMANWGFSYPELKKINPKLIYLSISGFGCWGPMGGLRAYDPTAQAMGGLASITGFEERGPIKTGSNVWIADWIAAISGAVAVLAALNYRERTGEGQFIDISQTESVIRFLDWTWLYVFKTGEDRKRSGNRDVAICPSDLFKCLDGWVVIAAFTEKEFCGLCEAMDRVDLYEKYGDPIERLKDENARKILSIISEWCKTKHVGEIVELANKYGFAASPVVEANDAYYSSHLRERGVLLEYEDTMYGKMVEPSHPPRLSETPTRIKWCPRPLGFDNEYVFTKILGLSLDEVRKLEKDGVIFKWDPEKPVTCPPPDWDGRSGVIFP